MAKDSFKDTAQAYERLLRREREVAGARPEDAEHTAQLALGDACEVLRGLRDQAELETGWVLAKSKSKDLALLMANPSHMDAFLNEELGLLVHVGLSPATAEATINSCRESFAKVRDQTAVHNLNPADWEKVFGVVMRLTCEFGIEEQRNFGFGRIMRHAVAVAGGSVVIVANVGSIAAAGIPIPGLVEASVLLGGAVFEDLRERLL